MNRLVIVPEESHEAIGAELRPRLAMVSREIDSENMRSLFNPQTLGVLEYFSTTLPGEILIWARHGNGYAVAWAADHDLIGRALADAGEGMIAQVFESGRSSSAPAENLELGEWCNLPQLLPYDIAEMAVAPLSVFGTCAAVVSIILREKGEARLQSPAATAALLSRLIEDKLIRMTLGLETA